MKDSHLEELLLRLSTDLGHPQFVQREAKTPSSSNLFYSASHEFFRKEKDRKPIKNAWEFLMLQIWQDVLERHSYESDINLSAPTSLVADKHGVTMEYLTAPNATHLNRLKKGVQTGKPFEDMRVEAALTYHAGVLCRIKEEERLLHRDFQVRHILYSYTSPALYTIDVENSRCGSDEEIRKENSQFESRLRRSVNGRLGKDKVHKPYSFDDLFRHGKNQVTSMHCIPDVVRDVEERFDIIIDVSNYGIALR